MKFGEIKLASAIGATLAHSVKAGGLNFKKGRVMSLEDIAALQQVNVETVFAARMNDGDLAEDEAAKVLARAAAGENVKVSEPFTGRANLYAKTTGLFMTDEQRVQQFNHLDEGLTIATLRSFGRVSEGQLVATVKIIPFALPKETVDAAAKVCETPMLSIAPFVSHSAGLIMTRIENMKDGLLAKTEQVIAQRLQACGSKIGASNVCKHTLAGVSRAITDQHSQGLSPILVFGASAIVDRGDVVPAGLVAAGGDVFHLGMPVDPGNLLMLGALDDTPVIGVPSCARSPKPNGFDWVLERLLAGLPVTGSDIMEMGAGGLLKEIPSRPRPRERAANFQAAAPAISALVLAAGRSTRMGVENKLLRKIGVNPMVRQTVETALASGVEDVIVVTGHQTNEVMESLKGLKVRFVENPNFTEGLSTSLKAGARALPVGCDGAIIMLGDMPLVSTEVLTRLIAAFDPVEGRSICVPTYDGKRGNPILWGAQFFPDFQALTGDIGAKHLLSENEDGLCEVAMADGGVLADFDTPDAFNALNET